MGLPSADPLKVDLSEGVLTLTLDHPPVNALTLALVQSLHKAFQEASRNDRVHCVLLAASGQVFSAGQDLREMLQAKDESYRRHLLQTYNPLILQIRLLEKPVLAAIQGTAAGAGLGITLACDLRIASPQASFVVGFSGIGLAPDSGVSLFLPALIGLGRATEAAFSNQPILAEQALQWGLVNQVAPAGALPAHALGLARQLAQGPVKALGLAKRAFNQAVYPNLEQVLDYEAHLQEIARQNPEHQEGVQAFLEKRRPTFAKDAN